MQPSQNQQAATHLFAPSADPEQEAISQLDEGRSGRTSAKIELAGAIDNKIQQFPGNGIKAGIVPVIAA